MNNQDGFQELKNACAGQWSTIMGALSSIDISDAIARSGKHVVCPFGHSKLKKFRVFKDFDTTGGAICVDSCGSWPDGFSWLSHANGWDRKTACREVATYLRERGQLGDKRVVPLRKPVAEKPTTFLINPSRASAIEKVWKESSTIGGTIGEKYLRDRGITADLPSASNVRYHPALSYWDEDTEQEAGVFPAIVSIVRSAEAGHPLTIHRTYLDPKGGKANVSAPKKLMAVAIDGSISRLGAAIRLFDLDGPYLAITEGMETAMAIRSANPTIPVWAAYSAGVMTNFQPPKSVKGIYIFGDLDSSGTGQIASAKLALQMEKLGIKTRIYLPEQAVSMAKEGSGWYSGEYCQADYEERLIKDGYSIREETSPDLDWLDIWNESPLTLERLLPQR